ncbi:PAS domain S-box-containing protein/diguanylate cyclase (GGDEF) domain-containing protein [Bradyrhizobium erythrophlei]|uniref:PAS domain S-box-containing protein/diguanylate cyclase (GGDEF) domain-containing protein n=1 Tax=Bradyrhizobium erythrophlei TaxID=1437360 RepID=A0A1M5VIJ5_9BRAD|nr:PAS domain S-box-containing protein/diguanylate cyclase (GGDEF) domain-containing protein [Bradyrhizobium erythrophlei]
MQSWLISFGRSLAPRWLLIAAVAFLLSMFFLIGNLYSSQVELRQNADARLISIGETRAAEIGDFLIERRQAAARLAGSEDISNYFSNLDLGMSVKYGLFANLAAIERRFQAAMDEEKYQGQPAYLRLAFFDRNGVVQVDIGASAAPTPSPTNLAEPSIQIDEKRRLIVAGAAVLQKGKMRGTVETVSSLNLLASLVSATDLGQPREFLLGDDGEVLLPIKREHSAIVTQGRELAALPSGRIQALSNVEAPELKGYLALRSPVGGTRLSILRLASEDELYGHTLSPLSVFYIGLFAIVLFVLAIGFERMRQNAARLQNKFVESNRHRAELAEHNLALSQEIERREAIETDLQRQSAALDKTNAELRIAAAAFNAQEGMIVTDTKGVILSANRAFVSLTGYTMEELVGQTASLFRSRRRDAEFYQSMWNSVHSTGGWQGDMSLRTKSGEHCARWLTISAVKNEASEVTNYIGSYYDISKLKHAEEKIRELAFFDQLTGLPNRVLLIDRVRQAFNANTRNKSFGALLFIDLDNFKTLNDSLGHDMGDLLLKKAAQRISSCVRADDTVARFGGDEFVVLLANLGTQKAKTAALQAEAIGEKILAAFTESFRLDPYEYPCTPSVGVTLFSPDDRNVDELLKRADLAMYDAKTAGRNGLRFFDPVMQTMISARAALETDLREDLKKERLLLHYQPQVDHEGRLLGAEALARWPHAQKGMVSPSEFIPVAESTGLILPLGALMLKIACRQLACWSADPATERLTVAINVSALQMRQKNFVEQVSAIIEQTGANPHRLKIELTESTLVSNVDDVIAKMDKLKAIGIGFSLDDFGTGYSSLSYLKRLPLDQLKIDRSFVKDVLVDPNDAAIAQMIIALSKSLGLSVIAEGVETEEQYAFLARHGQLNYQGYLFGRPLPPEDFERLARAFSPRRGPRQERASVDRTFA